MRLKQVAGKWKLDLLGSLGMSGEGPTGAGRIMRSIGQSAQLIAQNVGKGQYKTPDEMHADVQKSMAAAKVAEFFQKLRPRG